MSSISCEEIDWIIQQLTDLQSFLDRNTQFGLNSSADHANNGGQQDAILRERQSLMFLQQLLSHMAMFTPKSSECASARR